MTAELLFEFGPEIVLVRIEGNNVLFGNTSFGAHLMPIEGIKISKSGVHKQFPDLKDNSDWRKIAIARFKKHLRNLRTQRERAKYIEQDLRKYGYVLKKYQEDGQRPRGHI